VGYGLDDDKHRESKIADFDDQIRRFWSANSPILVSKFADFGLRNLTFDIRKSYLRHQETLPSASGSLSFGIRKP
jgi:hypothetical protein